MKRAIVERNIVALLFILVLITFSFAERDSKKLEQLYTKIGETGGKVYLAKLQTSVSEITFKQ
ncbi:MAG: hypothetical protein ICV66_11245 [Chitinophagaceae bacterium]|nr:hypothetical protein [Chitinophagaceae bacterium]